MKWGTKKILYLDGDYILVGDADNKSEYIISYTYKL